MLSVARMTWLTEGKVTELCEGWMGMAGRRRESKSAARTRYVHGRKGVDRRWCEELPKEGDGQTEKIDGTWDKNTMIIVCTCDGL